MDRCFVTPALRDARRATSLLDANLAVWQICDALYAICAAGFDFAMPDTYVLLDMSKLPASPSAVTDFTTTEKSRATHSRIIAALGPTNTGKTHHAIERMLGYSSGMIGLPLRLLAREIFERVVRVKGQQSVALITGEEKIIPQNPRYWVCTVEAMPLDREVDFVAVDEVQLCADRERGHLFSDRLLRARGRFETMFMGASTMAPLIRRLVPNSEIQARERLSSLTYAGHAKLTKLPKRSAVIAFSAENVYAIAELIRRHRGGAAVVMGSLSPRTRNAQVELFQSGEVDFLVATDAIGMGLNMDVDHVAFAGLRKFDGRRTRWLQPQEVGQIGGRAGRFRRDGTFGVTGDLSELDPEIVASVEAHTFAPVTHAEWRNADLDFSSLKGLISISGRFAPVAGFATCRRGARRNNIAHASGRRTRRKAKSRSWKLGASLGSLPNPRLSKDDARRSYSSRRLDFPAPDAGQPSTTRTVGARSVSVTRQLRWRHKRAFGPSRARAHSGLRRSQE